LTSKDRRFGPLAVAATLLSILSLGILVISAPLDARAEEHPKSTGYPAVGDMPPRPERPAMTADEMSKLKKDLSAARDRQTKGKASAGAGPGKP
jgi:hypothetical protein